MVQPQQLLLPGHDVRLGRGRPNGIDHEPGHVHPHSDQPGREALPGLIGADDAHKLYDCSQARGIGRRVAGAAGHPGALLQLDHRHGRFRRDAAHAAPDVLVEHDVADHQDPPATHVRDHLVQLPLHHGVDHEASPRRKRSHE